MHFSKVSLCSERSLYSLPKTKILVIFSRCFYECLFNFIGQPSVIKSYPGNYSCTFKDKTSYEKVKLIALCNNSMKTNISQKNLLVH